MGSYLELLPVPRDIESIFVYLQTNFRRVEDAISRLNAPSEDSGWVSPTLTNSWVEFNSGVHPVDYRKIGNKVHLRGLVRAGASSSSCFTLPVGFRPITARMIANLFYTGAAYVIGGTSIDTDGTVTCILPSGAVTDAAAWFALTGSFLTD